MTTLFLLAALLAAPGTWEALRSLEGDWTAEGGGGKPGQASAGGFSFNRELDGKILVRKNRAEYPATREHPAFVHEDLMLVYPDPDGQAPRAVYFDNEGHVIHYRVEAAGNTITFVSDPSPSAPQYRLTYVANGPGRVTIKFEIAPPGKGFATYVEAAARRKP